MKNRRVLDAEVVEAKRKRSVMEETNDVCEKERYSINRILEEFKEQQENNLLDYNLLEKFRRWIQDLEEKDSGRTDLLDFQVPKKNRHSGIPCKEPGNCCVHNHVDISPSNKYYQETNLKSVQHDPVKISPSKEYYQETDLTIKKVEAMIKINTSKKRMSSCLVNDREKGHQESKKSKKGDKGKRINFAKVGLEPPPPIPDEWMEKIKGKQGTKVQLVIMKQLFQTDLQEGHDRLSIPEKQVKDHTFLEDEEKAIISRGGHINVQVIEPCGVESQMSLRLWAMNTTFIYVLTTSWKKIFSREENRLTKNAILQVWSFRAEGKLCFVLVRVRDGDGHAHAADSKPAATDVNPIENEDHCASSSGSTVDD